MVMMNFNVNDYVYVKLTDYGREVHRKNHEKLFLNNSAVNYVPPKEDDEGWSKWQLWHLMQEFGPHMTVGMKIPFETVIKMNGEER